MNAFCFTTIALLMLTTPGFSYMLLDNVMPKSVQRRTGVMNLNHNQKLALEEWLNETFVLKTTEDQTVKEPLYISENINGGNQLKLSDGTSWEIDPSDVSFSSLWITGAPLKITRSHDPTYPWLLVNLDSGTGIKCRPLIQLDP